MLRMTLSGKTVMNAQTDRLIWVKGRRKNGVPFIELLDKLSKRYADKKKIHVIMGTYTMHSSKQTRTWLAEHGDRIVLHFLPPYCAYDNRIERCLYRGLHATGTYP
jgi:hypothetical protein